MIPDIRCFPTSRTRSYKMDNCLPSQVGDEVRKKHTKLSSPIKRNRNWCLTINSPKTKLRAQQQREEQVHWRKMNGKALYQNTQLANLGNIKWTHSYHRKPYSFRSSAVNFLKRVMYCLIRSKTMEMITRMTYLKEMTSINSRLVQVSILIMKEAHIRSFHHKLMVLQNQKEMW